MHRHAESTPEARPRDPAAERARPRFFARQLVTAADLNAGQDYLVAALRRHNRLLHGCGVICGLLVEAAENDTGAAVGVRVTGGAAIDGLGREIEVPDAVESALADLPFLVSTDAGRQRAGWPPPDQDGCLDCEPPDRRIWLALCHLETEDCPVPVIPDPCAGALDCWPARILDGWELVLLDRIEASDCVARGRPVEDPAWRGEYWALDDFDEPPSFPDRPSDFERFDPVIDFDWGTGPPAPEIAADHFVVRWTRRIHFPAGRYRFTATSDDGVRLRVDGRTVIDAWQARQEADSVGDTVLQAGVHTVVMEYFERRGLAVARLTWQALERGWHAEYYPLAGDAPPLLDDDGRPRPPGGLPPGVRPGTIAVGPAVPVVAGPANGPGEATGDATVGAATDRAPGAAIRRRVPARAALPFAAALDAPDLGVLFVPGLFVDLPPTLGPLGPGDLTLPSPAPRIERIDAGIALDLEPGVSPIPQLLPPDRFYVRWQRELEIDCPGLYELTAVADGGLRVWVDGDPEPVIDRWPVMVRGTATARVMLGPGSHRLRVGFFKLTGRGAAKLSWCRVGPYNPPCAPPRDPGCVVLAALEIRDGQLAAVENFALDPARALAREVLPAVGRLDACCCDPGCAPDGPVVASVVPTRIDRGTSTRGLIFGRRLAGASAVRFSGSGLEARVLPGGTDTWLPVELTAAGTATRNARAFQVVTPHCTFASGGVTVEVTGAGGVLPTDFFPTDFTITDFFPSVFVPTNFTTTAFGPSIFVPTDFAITAFGPSIFVPPIIAGPGFGRPGATVPVVGGPIVAGPIDATLVQPLDRFFADRPGVADALVADGIADTAALANVPASRVAALLGITPVRAMDLISTAVVSLRPADDDDPGQPTTPPVVVTPTQPPVVVAPTQPPLVVTPTQPPLVVTPIQPPVVVTPIQPVVPVIDVGGIGPVRSDRLRTAGIETAAELATALPARVAEVLSVSPTLAARLIAAARERLEGDSS